MTREDPTASDDLTVVSIAKRQWERTFDAISDPLMIIDGDYVIRRANLALADDLGTAVQRVVGRQCHEVRRQSTQAFPAGREDCCAGCPVPEARALGAPRDGELLSRAGRLYRLRAYPLDERVGERGEPGGDGAGRESGALMVCSYRDVTDERERSRQLSNAEKLAAVGRLAGGVAHEINNPLGGILAFAQLLLRDRCTAEEQREYLHEIEKSAFRCKGVVEALLRFAQQGPEAPRTPVALGEVVKEALTLVSYKYALREVEVCTELDPDLAPVLGNAHQLEQVVVNLLSNAFDAITSAGAPGTIEVRTSMVGRSVALEVADSGTGIAEEHLARIFDPFFTTKTEQRGTGLGLAVTHAIVREHGGDLTARNRPGGGAIFIVTLPAG